MTVLLIDWLGRGGIAQCSEAWAIELGRLGIDVEVVTRPHRELGDTGAPWPASREGNSRLGAHRKVINRAVERIRERRPATVVIQNYLVPHLEISVVNAAKAVSAQVVFVVHDHRPHTWQAGTRFGLRRLLHGADDVLAHSSFVAERTSAYAQREVLLLPHPKPLGLLAHEGTARSLSAPTGAGQRVALHFGVVKRGYKGTDTVAAMAALGGQDWIYMCAGVGAPTSSPNVLSRPGFLPARELVSLVAGSDVVLLPYRRASQSGAVVLAQCLGSVPIASAVGGIPEQIRDRETGLLVPAGAGPGEWSAVLADVDPTAQTRMGQAARKYMDERHSTFVDQLKRLLAAPRA